MKNKGIDMKKYEILQDTEHTNGILHRIKVAIMKLKIESYAILNLGDMAVFLCLTVLIQLLKQIIVAPIKYCIERRYKHELSQYKKTCSHGK